MYEDLKGKTALVTGAGKKTGIGYAIAGRLAAGGSLMQTVMERNRRCKKYKKSG
jgi:NAD(P)-dependent dehydrogenase (short-subunit alcohol dehydrogenase family)